MNLIRKSTIFFFIENICLTIYVYDIFQSVETELAGLSKYVTELI